MMHENSLVARVFKANYFANTSLLSCLDTYVGM